MLRFNFLPITIFGLCLFVAALPPQPAEGATPNPKVVEGTRLFNQSCKSCHGPMEEAYIVISSTADIKEAIKTVPKMKALFEGKLREAELEALVAAFNAPSLPATTAQTEPKTDADKKISASDAKLFSLAKKFFPGEEGPAAKKRIVRLTRLQLDRAVRTLLPQFVEGSLTATMPKDSLQTNYEFSENLFINPANFSQLTAWIGAIAERVRKNPEGLFPCKAAANPESCRLELAGKFLQRAFRGEADPGRDKRFVDFFSSQQLKSGFEQAAGDFVEVVLNSPAFLFRNETNVAENGSLTRNQLISQLAFSFADALPEALGIPAGSDVNAISTKVIESRQGREKLLRFFLSWLEIKEPGEFKISNVASPQFTPEVGSALVADFRRTLHHSLSQPAPKLNDVILAKEFFPSSASAFIYDAKKGAADGKTPVTQDASRRSGLFSHPAFIASHSGPTSTRPIKRGVFWVRKVMCMPLEPPPAGLDTTIKPTTEVTERKRVEAGTSSKTCMGCHRTINPFGFMLENFGMLGEWRDREGNFPVDARVTMETVLEDGPITFSGPTDALTALTQSPRFRQCFARQLFRYYMGRNETETDDPVLREMFYELSQSGSLDGALKALSSSSSVTKREK